MSPGGMYRYDLYRRWDDGFLAEGLPSESDDWALFIMLNPSTGDATRDDNTVRRCMSFARREGFGGLAIINRFAYRTPHPTQLIAARNAGTDIVGPENDVYWRWWLDRASLVIAAWGANSALSRLPAPVGLPAETWCLGTTKGGQPCHPLFLADDTKLERFR